MQSATTVEELRPLNAQLDNFKDELYNSLDGMDRFEGSGAGTDLGRQITPVVQFAAHFAVLTVLGEETETATASVTNDLLVFQLIESNKLDLPGM